MIMQVYMYFEPALMTICYSTAPTAPPQEVAGVAFNSSAITISWLPPPFEHQNGVIVGYTVHILEVVTNQTTTIEVEGPHIEIFVGFLHPYYIYAFSVAAKTIELGPLSHTNMVRTNEDGKGIYLHVYIFNICIIKQHNCDLYL